MPTSAPTQVEVDARVRADGAAERKFVRPGWSKGRVLAGLGPPDRKRYVGGEAWFYLPTAKDVQTATMITFTAIAEHVRQVAREARPRAYRVGSARLFRR
jgi:hypothetical protein